MRRSAYWTAQVVSEFNLGSYSPARSALNDVREDGSPGAASAAAYVMQAGAASLDAVLDIPGIVPCKLPGGVNQTITSTTSSVLCPHLSPLSFTPCADV